jgi:hypothetical protein
MPASASVSRRGPHLALAKTGAATGVGNATVAMVPTMPPTVGLRSSRDAAAGHPARSPGGDRRQAAPRRRQDGEKGFVKARQPNSMTAEPGRGSLPRSRGTKEQRQCLA